MAPDDQQGAKHATPTLPLSAAEMAAAPSHIAMSSDKAKTAVGPDATYGYRARIEAEVRFRQDLTTARQTLFQQVMSLLGDSATDTVKHRSDFEEMQKASNVVWLRQAVLAAITDRDAQDNIFVLIARDARTTFGCRQRKAESLTEYYDRVTSAFIAYEAGGA